MPVVAGRARQKLVVFAEMDNADCAFVLDAFTAADRYKAKPSTQSARQHLADFLQMANAEEPVLQIIRTKKLGRGSNVESRVRPKSIVGQREDCET